MGTYEDVRHTIVKALEAFSAEPFYNLREADPQAELLGSLRSALQPALVDAHLKKKTGTLVPPTVRTSRVHTEMRLGKNQWIDLVVFRSDVVPELELRPAGALDVIAPVRPIDLAALIEIKAAPSSSAAQQQSFVNDLKRLAQHTADLDHCLGFFVLFDKSLFLQGRKTRSRPRFSWTQSIRPNPIGKVEAHWLGDQGRPASVRGDVLLP